MTLRDELFKNQDLEYKAFQSKLVPNIDADSIIGVRLPVLRQIAKGIANKNIDFPIRYYEEIMIKGLTIGYEKCSIEKHLADLENFVPLIDNWAVCDSVCSTLKFTEKNRERVFDFILQYSQGSEYEVRFLAVMLMDYYLTDEYIDRVLEILTSVHRQEYYINMAVAWALSTAFVKYESKVMPIFEDRSLNPFVHNKAIQKSRESFRVDKETKDYINTLKIKNR